MRLDKFLSESTDMSRKEIKHLIKHGAVNVCGRTDVSADMHIDMHTRVFVEGTEIMYRKFIYLVMNKPAGYVSATFDRRDPTVVELVPEEYAHYAPFPVGRLDIDTEGLLILTNDGQLAHELTSPKKNIYKKYYVQCDKAFEKADIDKFGAGMDLGDFTARPAYLELTERPDCAYVSICEGKFHQVKRMCEKTGKTVVYLKRVSIGGLVLPPDLKPGQCREYTKEMLLNEIGKRLT